MNNDEASIVFRDSAEIWLIRGNLVASQRAYSFPYMRDSWRENRYYYCGTCGEVWGKRLDTEAPQPRHLYIRSSCASCGGIEDMRYPWEEKNSWVHSASVLAHLLMIHTQTLEVENES